MKNDVCLKLSKSQRSFKDKVTPKKKDRKLVLLVMSLTNISCHVLFETDKLQIIHLHFFTIFLICNSNSYNQKNKTIYIFITLRVLDDFLAIMYWKIEGNAKNYFNSKARNFQCFKLPSVFNFSKLVLSTKKGQSGVSLTSSTAIQSCDKSQFLLFQAALWIQTYHFSSLILSGFLWL